MKHIKIIEISFVGIRRKVDLRALKLTSDNRVVLLCKINRLGYIRYLLFEYPWAEVIHTQKILDSFCLRVISPYSITRDKWNSSLLKLLQPGEANAKSVETLFLNDSNYHVINGIKSKLHSIKNPDSEYIDYPFDKYIMENLLDEEVAIVKNKVIDYIKINYFNSDIIDAKVSTLLEVNVLKEFEKGHPNNFEDIFLSFQKE